MPDMNALMAQAITISERQGGFRRARHRETLSLLHHIFVERHGFDMRIYMLAGFQSEFRK